MRKLALALDALQVESFDTSAGRPSRGTVFGEQCTCYTNCTCPGCPTCDNTCADTCDQTCAASCIDCGTQAYSCWATCSCESETGAQIICQC